MTTPKVLLVANTGWYLFRFRLAWARFLRARGWQVVFVSPPDRFVPHLEAAGFAHRPWRLERRSVQPWKELRAVRAFRRILQQERPVLVHLHTIKPMLYGALASWGMPARVIATVTGRGYVFLSPDRQARVLRQMLRPLYRLADRRLKRIIFEHEWDRAFFVGQGLFSEAKSAIVEGVGVDVETFRPAPEPPLPLTVVLPGRMLWDKGVGTFVEAARHYRAQGRALRAVLVGMPDPGNPSSIPEATLRAWVDEGVVEWWGWQTDMPRVFAAAHVVTLPSLAEGVPTVLLEAAASGRPAVATDVPGCRAVVYHEVTGLLVPPQDPQALAQAWQRLAQDPELRRRLGQTARHYAEARWSLTVIHRQLWQIYQQVAQEAP